MRGKKCALGVELDMLHGTGASIFREGVTKVAGEREGGGLAILTMDLVQERGQKPGVASGGVGKKCSDVGSG